MSHSMTTPHLVRQFWHQGGDWATALDIVLYRTHGDNTDWFSVKQDFDRYLDTDPATVRELISYIRNHWDQIYGS